jgi:hypothetical protein
VFHNNICFLLVLAFLGIDHNCTSLGFHLLVVMVPAEVQVGQLPFHQPTAHSPYQRKQLVVCGATPGQEGEACLAVES